MGIFKSIREAINRAFRKYYENRISLPYGVLQFMSSVAFIQLDKGECVPLAPYRGVGYPILTVEGMRPVLTYEVFPVGGPHFRYVQTIVEDRGFQLKRETEESRADRQSVISANSRVNKVADLKPIPNPIYQADWDLVDIEDPHVAPLKDLFLGFSFYQSLTKGQKLKLDVPNG